MSICNFWYDNCVCKSFALNSSSINDSNDDSDDDNDNDNDNNENNGENNGDDSGDDNADGDDICRNNGDNNHCHI